MGRNTRTGGRKEIRDARPIRQTWRNGIVRSKRTYVQSRTPPSFKPPRLLCPRWGNRDSGITGLMQRVTERRQVQASGSRTARQGAYRDQHDIRDSGFSSRDSFCSYSMECLSFPQRESAGRLVPGGKGWNRAPSADTHTVSGASDAAPRKRSPTALPKAGV